LVRVVDKGNTVILTQEVFVIISSAKESSIWPIFIRYLTEDGAKV
jgi:hypothetical protein